MEILEAYPVVKLVLSILGALVIVAQVVIALTPSQKDDLKLAEFKKNGLVKVVWSFLLSFAPIQKKDGKAKLSKE